MEYDQHNNVKSVIGLATVTIATDTTTNGVIIDTQGFGSLEYHIVSGTITDGDYNITLEDGEDSGLSDAAAVPSDQVLGALPSFAAADDDTVKRVGSISKKRYQRLNIVSASTTSGGTFTVLVTQGVPSSAPVA